MPYGDRYFSIMGNLDWVFKTIIGKRLLPAYDSTLEACCGAGELIWHTQPPTHKEFMNDFDQNVVRIHSITQKLTNQQITKLKEYNWVADQKHFDYVLKEFVPQNDIDFLYRRLYLHALKEPHDDVEHAKFLSKYQDEEKTSVQRLEQARNRLRNIQLLNMDAIDAIKTVEEEKNMFVFIDPPYPSKDDYYLCSCLDWNKLYETLSNTHLKWMLVSSMNYTKNGLENMKTTMDNWIYARRTMEKLIANFNSIKVTEKVKLHTLFKNSNYPEKEFYIVYNYQPHKNLGEYFA